MRKGVLFAIVVLVATTAVLFSCGTSKKVGEEPNAEDELSRFQSESFKASLVPAREGIDADLLKKKAGDFFEALINKDFEKAAAIAGCPGEESSLETHYGNVVEIISIGDPLRQEGSRYPGVFIPYEIKFASGEVKKWQIAMKRKEGEWVFDGGL